MKKLTDSQKELLRRAQEDKDFCGVFLAQREGTNESMVVQHFDCSPSESFNMCASELLDLFPMSPDPERILEEFIEMARIRIANGEHSKKRMH